LFYLRSVAPHEDYTDRVTKQPIKKVTIEQIYWGAVPFVVIQVIMVGLIIAFPGLVSSGLTKEPTIDADKALQQMQVEQQRQTTQEAAPAPAASSAPAAPQAPGGKEEKEDPMKQLLESMKQEQPKKP
ncbi:MAG: C4-dicarboxylate ABC transporter, partial [Ramlibacter sp.]